MVASILREFLERADARGARSTVLRPMGWLVFILFVGIVSALAGEPPDWLMKVLTVLLVVAVTTYLIAYGYFAIRNPDALRSEKFTLSKMAIERTLTGDTLKGFIETNILGETAKELPQTSSPETKGEDG